MASPYARKVDQQRLYVRHTVEVIPSQSGVGAAAFVQAGYLQLEMALRFYLLELIGKNTGGVTETPLDARLFSRLLEQAPSLELTEFVELSQVRASWLTTFAEQLAGLRQVEHSNNLRGDIFQLEEQSYDANTIASRDVSHAPTPANLDDLQAALKAFEGLVGRQRAVREEY